VKATRKALEECGPEIEPLYREQIETALTEVGAALGSEGPNTQTGDTARLKKAVTALDEVTRPLAEVLMDRAMEAVLRKRGLIQ